MRAKMIKYIYIVMLTLLFSGCRSTPSQDSIYNINYDVIQLQYDNLKHSTNHNLLIIDGMNSFGWGEESRNNHIGANKSVLLHAQKTLSNFDIVFAEEVSKNNGYNDDSISEILKTKQYSNFVFIESFEISEHKSGRSAVLNSYDALGNKSLSTSIPDVTLKVYEVNMLGKTATGEVLKNAINYLASNNSYTNTNNLSSLYEISGKNQYLDLTLARLIGIEINIDGHYPNKQLGALFPRDFDLWSLMGSQGLTPSTESNLVLLLPFSTSVSEIQLDRLQKYLTNADIETSDIILKKLTPLLEKDKQLAAHFLSLVINSDNHSLFEQYISLNLDISSFSRATNLAPIQVATIKHIKEGNGLIYIKSLLTHGADINTQNIQGLTPLKLAITTNAGESIKLVGIKDIIKLGANLNLETKNGNTALFSAYPKDFDAMGKSHEAMINFLIDNGANAQYKNRNGQTAAQYYTEGRISKRQREYEKRQNQLAALEAENARKQKEIKDREINLIGYWKSTSNSTVWIFNQNKTGQYIRESVNGMPGTLVIDFNWKCDCKNQTLLYTNTSIELKNSQYPKYKKLNEPQKRQNFNLDSGLLRLGDITLRKN